MDRLHCHHQYSHHLYDFIIISLVQIILTSIYHHHRLPLFGHLAINIGVSTGEPADQRQQECKTPGVTITILNLPILHLLLIIVLIHHPHVCNQPGSIGPEQQGPRS